MKEEKQQKDLSGQKPGLNRRQRRSFMIFFIMIICLMILTGWMGIMDIWYGDVSVSTGLNEKKTLSISEDLQVTLGGSSDLTFHKSAQREFRLNGYADIEVNNSSEMMEFETRDLVAEVYSAEFWIESTDSTRVGVRTGKVDLLVKSVEKDSITLVAGEEYSYFLDDHR